MYSTIERFSIRKCILTNVQTKQISRIQTDENQRKKKRSWSKVYHFAMEGMRECVCKSFLLSTLNINHCPADNTCLKRNESGVCWGGWPRSTRRMEVKQQRSK
ncbi:hypothetical protein PoB_004855900 [Plakobranchus ocellatus]|uniref:Uncharacterized protein n=1 Tax=Plakobranchus ocellatus TaxID=259542 RepID=A0AAV4BPL8_9GAST|nr:hypothetical protein PoB_004855900 [Plakobranchus ocellatus]